MLDSQEFAKDEHEASLMVTAGQILTGTVAFLIVMPFVEVPRFHVTQYSVIALIYTGLFATCLTAYLQSRYQHHVSPTAAAVIYMLEPVVAAIIAEVFLTERMAFWEMFGAGLIIIGVIIAQVKVHPSRSYST
jgi:drug/metabolite transporter (DMT)-like permease